MDGMDNRIAWNYVHFIDGLRQSATSDQWDCDTEKASEAKRSNDRGPIRDELIRTTFIRRTSFHRSRQSVVTLAAESP